MARPVSPFPTDLELEILKILWEAAPQTVSEIREALARVGRDLAHTTVITMLGTMVSKKQIKKLEPESGKAFRFVPLVEHHDVSRRMLGDLFERVFAGSAEAVVQGLFDVADLDQEELAQLRKLLNKKTKESRE
ncbi:MAG: BlaI/MecI/CopY family transcriptional regulator [Pirellulaceae bacterium]|nr:BlaI/MecI/CopY family transcriptional regulator [Pirellulaceae bacterium]